jgi:hypothetical protein
MRCTKNNPECYARAFRPEDCTCPRPRRLSAADELRAMVERVERFAKRKGLHVLHISEVTDMLKRQAARLDRPMRFP